MEEKKELRKRGLNFENFKELSCGEVAKLAKEMGINCNARFNQFLNHTRQNAKGSHCSVVPVLSGVSSQFPQVGCGELRSSKKCKQIIQNGLVPTFSQAQEFLEVAL